MARRKKDANENILPAAVARIPQPIPPPAAPAPAPAAPAITTRRPKLEKLAPGDVPTTDIMVRAQENNGKCYTEDTDFVDKIHRWTGIGATSVTPSEKTAKGDPAQDSYLIYGFDHSKEQLEAAINQRQKEVKGQ